MFESSGAAGRQAENARDQRRQSAPLAALSPAKSFEGPLGVRLVVNPRFLRSRDGLSRHLSYLLRT